MSDSFVIYDGLSLIYRSFFAIKKLNAPDGFPTNALFGFIKTLNQINKRWKPNRHLVALDGGSPKQRLDLLPEYKANRTPMPDDLRKQLPIIEEYLVLSGIPFLRQIGREADDIIASVAISASVSGAEVMIASSDKDLFQLVDDRVSMIMPLQPDQLFKAADVQCKMGVSPSQIVDLLSLTGDSADNIDGVDGIGKKTAADLLKEFNTIDGIFENISRIKSDRIRSLLLGKRDLLERNRNIVRLILYDDCSYVSDKYRISKVNSNGLVEFYMKYGMNSMARDMLEPELF